MKKFKKVCGIFLALALTSCTNMSSQKIFDKVGGIFDNKGTGKVVEIKNEKKDSIKKIEIENKTLKSENVDFYLSLIKNRLKTRQKIERDNREDDYQVLLGEYLVLNTNGANKVKVVSSPKNTNPRVRLNGEKIYFRSIYKGNYGINLYQNNSLAKKMNISVISKNNFSESNIYDIILENSAKNNKTLKNAVTLYKMYYPNGKHYKNVSYELLKYGYTNNNKAIMGEALKVLKSDIGYFNDEEKILILKAATLTKERIFVPEKVYFTSDKKLQNTLAGYVKSKDILDKKDKIFLEKNFPDYLDEINEKKEEISNKEAKDNFLEKVQEKIETKKKNNVKEYKKALSQEKSKEKKAEIYYNLMNQAVKSGNRVKALRYLSLIKQQDSNGEWARKAQILANKIK